MRLHQRYLPRAIVFRKFERIINNAIVVYLASSSWPIAKFRLDFADGTRAYQSLQSWHYPSFTGAWNRWESARARRRDSTSLICRYLSMITMHKIAINITRRATNPSSTRKHWNTTHRSIFIRCDHLFLSISLFQRLDLGAWPSRSLHKDWLLGDETGSEEEEERGHRRGLRQCRGRRGHHRVE